MASRPALPTLARQMSGATRNPTVPNAGLDEATITVVLADDHQIVRDAIKLILDSEPDMEVVGEAGDADSAARHVLAYSPAVLLLDLNMPGRPSLGVIPQLRERATGTQTIVLTGQSEPDSARRALAFGARGYVLKHSAASELVTAIRQVLSGEIYISPDLEARMAAA